MRAESGAAYDARQRVLAEKSLMEADMAGLEFLEDWVEKTLAELREEFSQREKGLISYRIKVREQKRMRKFNPSPAVLEKQKD